MLLTSHSAVWKVHSTTRQAACLGIHLSQPWRPPPLQAQLLQHAQLILDVSDDELPAGEVLLRCLGDEHVGAGASQQELLEVARLSRRWEVPAAREWSLRRLGRVPPNDLDWHVARAAAELVQWPDAEAVYLNLQVSARRTTDTVPSDPPSPPATCRPKS